jgi:hypothetical protein
VDSDGNGVVNNIVSSVRNIVALGDLFVYLAKA